MISINVIIITITITSHSSIHLYTCRPLECIRVKSSLSSKWNGIIWIAEDAAMIDASMDTVSSREVRQKMRRKKSVKHLVGSLIDAYFKEHLIGAKVRIVYCIAVYDRCEYFSCLWTHNAKIIRNIDTLTLS